MDARLGHHPGDQREGSSRRSQGVGTAEGMAGSDSNLEEAALDIRAAEPVQDD